MTPLRPRTPEYAARVRQIQAVPVASPGDSVRVRAGRSAIVWTVSLVAYGVIYEVVYPDSGWRDYAVERPEKCEVAVIETFADRPVLPGRVALRAERQVVGEN